MGKLSKAKKKITYDAKLCQLLDDQQPSVKNGKSAKEVLSLLTQIIFFIDNQIMLDLIEKLSLFSVCFIRIKKQFVTYLILFLIIMCFQFQ